MVTSIQSHRVFISYDSKFSLFGSRFCLSTGYYPAEPDFRITKIESLRLAIERFIRHVLQPLLTLYGLLPQSVNVFHDSVGPLIAFNRSGGIFVNVRYYCAWHDEVRQ